MRKFTYAYFRATSNLCSMSDPFGNWMGQNDTNPGGAPAGGPRPIGAPRGDEENDDNTNISGGKPPANNGGTNKTNTDDNSGTNIDLVATIWDAQTDPNADKGGVNNANNNQNNQNNPPQQQTEEQLQQQVNAFVAKAGISPITLSEQELEAFKSGEGVQPVLDRINHGISTAFLQGITKAQELFQKQMPALVEQAVNKSKSFYQGEQLRAMLHDKLPFTRDPAIGPVAETVMRQFLTKGATPEKALELTREYYTRLHKQMDPNYVPPNPNTRTNFRGNPRDRNTGAKSWLGVLTGKD